MLNRSGREEKRVEAHTGAVITVRWNNDGTGFATGGEDGAVKVWSRTGMLRSVLAQNEQPVHAVAWSPDGDRLLFSSGNNLTIMPLQAPARPVSWLAFPSSSSSSSSSSPPVVLSLAWSPVTGLIAAAGEDRRVRVFDDTGGAVNATSVSSGAVTAVVWGPDGDSWAAAGFESVAVGGVDESGVVSRLRVEGLGSPARMAWSPDGTMIGLTGANGTIWIAQASNLLY
eukprot:jgi/Chlat1/7437/Chrsp6S07454